MSRLSFDFATRGGSARRRHDDEVTRVLVIADLRGDARPAQAPGLTNARIVSIDVDNFDSVLRTFHPHAAVGSGLLTFESMADFHPDRLLDVLGSVTAPQPATPVKTSVAEQTQLLADDTPTPADTEDDTQTLARLLGRPVAGAARANKGGSPPPAAVATPPKSSLDEMLRALVAPHIVRPQPSAASASSDQSAVMRGVLHAPAFQRVEAAWRGLRWLVCESPLGYGLQVNVLEASRADLIADLRACQGDLESSQLYRLVVREQAGGPDATPYSLAIGDFGFAGSDEDVSLLAGLGAVSARAGACFLGAAEPPLWGATDLSREPERGYWTRPDPEITARMSMLRSSAVAPFIGLCMPRVLGRVPYGERSDPVDRFDFTELDADPAHADFLWINGAYACAQLILAGVAERGWSDGPGSTLDLGALPHAVYRSAGGDAVKPCAEVFLDEGSAEHVLACGIMPMLSYRNRNAIRLARLQSIASPAAALAFPAVRPTSR